MIALLRDGTAYHDAPSGNNYLGTKAVALTNQGRVFSSNGHTWTFIPAVLRLL